MSTLTPSRRPIVTSDQVKATLNWRLQSGQRPKFILVSKCIVGRYLFDFMCTKLAEIRQKNDERWNWYLFPQEHYPFWQIPKDHPLQGVAKTKEEAIELVMKFWQEDRCPDCHSGCDRFLLKAGYYVCECGNSIFGQTPAKTA